MNRKEIGFIGLGKMGKNMVLRMLNSKTINAHIYDISQDIVKELDKKGATGHTSIEDLIQGLWKERKIIWMMLPAGKITEDTFQELLKLLKKGDIIIDGGNSNFKDTLKRHKECETKGIEMLDVGVSGGIISANKGYPMMIGGKKETYNYCKPIFTSFGIPEGFNLVGDKGSGHYVKMIHNSIEYGMMQAISEGFDLLENGSIQNLDLKKISHIWNHGTIIESFLMKMVENALTKNVKLNYLKPYVEDNGEGKWASIEALEQNVPFVVNTYAINARYISRDKNSMTFKMLAAMRNEFGGHPIKKNFYKQK